MTTVFDVQRALKARNFDIGDSGPNRDGVDGEIGPDTLTAILSAIDRLPLPVATIAPVPSTPIGIVPADWMPWCSMDGIIVHWTAGGGKASAKDKEHYHILLEDDGKLVRGDHSILDNVSAADGRYAAHTKGANTRRIAVSLCGMRGSNQSPFHPGPSPITSAQWAILPQVLADLCRRYAINPTREKVLSHAEVERTLGIKQAGKWDIAILPFRQNLNTATKVGDEFRAMTKRLL